MGRHAATKHPVPDRVKPAISPERQSGRMSKITNGGLTRSDTGCFVAVYLYGNSGRQRLKAVD